MNTTATTRTTAQTTVRDLQVGQTVVLNGQPELVTGKETERRKCRARVLTDRRDCLGMMLNLDVKVTVLA